MGWFSRKERPKPSLKTRLGIFRFDDTGWMTDPDEATLVFQYGHNQLDMTAIERAEGLVQELDVLSQRAIHYAKTHGDDVWDCQSGLVLEAFDITEILDGRFGLTFGVEGEPDFTVTVEFAKGEPVEVWGAD